MAVNPARPSEVSPHQTPHVSGAHAGHGRPDLDSSDLIPRARDLAKRMRDPNAISRRPVPQNLQLAEPRLIKKVLNLNPTPASDGSDYKSPFELVASPAEALRTLLGKGSLKNLAQEYYTETMALQRPKQNKEVSSHA